MTIYLKLFLTFLKIGAFTFGGGYAMLPLIQQEVIKNGWLTEEQILNFIAVSESTPRTVRNQYFNIHRDGKRRLFRRACGNARSGSAVICNNSDSRAGVYGFPQKQVCFRRDVRSQTGCHRAYRRSSDNGR